MKNIAYFVLFTLFLFLTFSSQSFSQITSTQSGNWSDAATWTGGVVPTSGDNVVVSNTVTVDIADAVCNDLTVADGGRVYFDVNTGMGITVDGSIVVNNNGRIQAAGSTPSSGQYFQSINLKKDLTVETGGRFDMRQSSGSNLAVCRLVFSGTSNSTINLSLTTYTSNTEEFNSVEINKTGGAKVILASGTLFMNNNSSNGADTLVLVSGVVETGSNQWVTLRTSSAAIIGGSSSSYFNGIIGHGISNGGGDTNEDFPVGDADAYRPLNIRFNAPSNSTGHYVWVMLHPGDANTGSSTFGSGIDKVSSLRYYEVGYAAGATGTATMDMYGFSPTYNTDDGVTAGNMDLRVAYSTDARATWNDAGPTDHTTNPPDTLDSDSLTTAVSLASDTSMFVALASAEGTSTNPLPVELTSFTYQVNKMNVSLFWNTATEINNAGFEIQRSADNLNFSVVAFVKGAGTSSKLSTYSFTDKNLNNVNKVYYRLKQIDFSGKTALSKTVEVSLEKPLEYRLNQNYPNPFNPSTKISYSIAVPGMVRLSVYNAIGEKIMELANEYKEAGEYSLNFNASSLVSGVYFYKIETGNFVKIMKMMLVK